MHTIIIAAVAQNNAIGKNNNLLWHLPADMRFFKDQTNGHAVITGRKNYESIPEKFRPLPNRQNIVITRDKTYLAPGAVVSHSLEEALSAAKKARYNTCFIIGGGEIYKETLEKGLADEMLITHVAVSPEADTFFPEFDATEWEKETIEALPSDEKNKFAMTFCRYIRKKK